MSRIGKMPVQIPAGVTIKTENNIVTVKGPKGELNQYVHPCIKIELDGGQAVLTRVNDEKETRAKHGLYRALLQNMVTGVTQGFERGLIINGVGYKVAKQGNGIVLNVGYSHPVEYTALPGVTLECPAQNEVLVKGINKVDVGQVAASIRAIRKPEPYHGYGIRYKDEVIQRKEGKTAGK